MITNWSKAPVSSTEASWGCQSRVCTFSECLRLSSCLPSDRSQIAAVWSAEALANAVGARECQLKSNTASVCPSNPDNSDFFYNDNKHICRIFYLLLSTPWSTWVLMSQKPTRENRETKRDNGWAYVKLYMLAVMTCIYLLLKLMVRNIITTSPIPFSFCLVFCFV